MENVHAMSDKKSLFKLGCMMQASTKHGTTKKTTPNCDGICTETAKKKGFKYPTIIKVESVVVTEISLQTINPCEKIFTTTSPHVPCGLKAARKSLI